MYEEERILDWEGCDNVRDLGGLPLIGGGATRTGRLVRADVLGRLTPLGKQQLLDYGIRTIIDLRSPQEIAELPSALFDGHDQAPNYVPVGWQPNDPGASARFKKAQTRAELYIIANDYFATRNGWIMRAISQAQPGGVVFHCHSGKDRTGIAAALLLSLAGVEREAIAADYALTQRMLWPRYQRWVEEQGGVEEIDRWSIPDTEPQTMLETLADLDDAHGGVEEYLLQAGQTPEEIARLKSILT